MLYPQNQLSLSGKTLYILINDFSANHLLKSSKIHLASKVHQLIKSTSKQATILTQKISANFQLQSPQTKKGLTRRLVSGSESHCSKRSCARKGFDLRAKGETSGNCNSSASRDNKSPLKSISISTR